jgi:dTDP-4-dehydrorhamnose reductase
MTDKNILIMGANGQLGLALQKQYPSAAAFDSSSLDITSSKELESFDWSDIRVIINSAAYTAVDGAETDEGRVSAWKVNAVGPANLSKIASEKEITLVHISSDYVFDGSKPLHSESEYYSPLGVYGQSKAAGDISVGLTPKNYTLRTSWVIGEGKNFVRTMIDLGKREISPTVVDDQMGRLTFTSEIVRAIEHLLNTSPSYGVYNISNGGVVVSWADITREIFAIANFEQNVSGTSTEEYYKDKPAIASRPLNSALDLTKIEATGFEPIDWKIDLAKYIKKEIS